MHICLHGRGYSVVYWRRTNWVPNKAFSFIDSALYNSGIFQALRDIVSSSLRFTASNLLLVGTKASWRHMRCNLNAFLNTSGGQIWFGVAADGSVKGLQADRKERDRICLRADAIINAMHPQVWVQKGNKHYLQGQPHIGIIISSVEDFIHVSIQQYRGTTLGGMFICTISYLGWWPAC